MDEIDFMPMINVAKVAAKFPKPRHDDDDDDDCAQWASSYKLVSLFDICFLHLCLCFALFLMNSHFFYTTRNKNISQIKKNFKYAHGFDRSLIALRFKLDTSLITLVLDNETIRLYDCFTI